MADLLDRRQGRTFLAARLERLRFDVLDALQEQGLVAFSRSSKSLQLTDDGFFIGNVLATRIAMMFMDVMDRTGDAGMTAEVAPSERNGTGGPATEGPRLHVLDGDKTGSGSSAADMPSSHNAPVMHDPFGFAFGTPFGSVPLEAHPAFDPLESRRDPDPRAFRLRIELDLEDLHPCWREVLVPATCTFLDLHVVIQRVFNWYDEHLFDFEMTARG